MTAKLEAQTMRRNPAITAKTAICAGLLALAALLPGQARADTPGEARAQKLINDQKSVIGRFMHPTSSLDKIVCTKTKRYETGEFYLVYAFYFDGEKYNSSLRFKFFEDGSLDAIEVAGTTTWIKPFQAADLVANTIINLAPAPVADKIHALLKDGAAKTALEFWLRSR
jgi:hypothetical protein